MAQTCLGQGYGLKTLSTNRKLPFLTKFGRRLQVQASGFKLMTPYSRSRALTTRLYTIHLYQGLIGVCVSLLVQPLISSIKVYAVFSVQDFVYVYFMSLTIWSLASYSTVDGNKCSC